METNKFDLLAKERVKPTGGPRIEVREYSTRKLVKTIKLQSPDPIRAEKVLVGLLRHMNTDLYYAVEKGLAKPKAKPASC